MTQPLQTPRDLAGSSWQAEPVAKLTLPFPELSLSVPLPPMIKESFWERLWNPAAAGAV